MRVSKKFRCRKASVPIVCFFLPKGFGGTYDGKQMKKERKKRRARKGRGRGPQRRKIERERLPALNLSATGEENQEKVLAESGGTPLAR